ncbi:MAG: AraC family transcriptional regulator [Cyclobacteriaceae bacterium]
MNKAISKFTFSLLNADAVHLNKNWNYRNIISPFYRLYFIDEGMGTLSTSSQSHLLEKGHLYLIPGFTICNYCCTDYLHQYYLHFTEESTDGTSLFLWNRKIFKVRANHIDIANFKRLLKINYGRSLIKSENPRDYEKGPILKGFQELNDLLPVAAYMETQGIILQLLSRFLASEHFQFGRKNVIPSKISNAIQYIQSNLQITLTVSDLAARANQNADYFSRVFAEQMGERPLAYIQLKRIERAQFLIITTGLSFTEIAGQTGFETLSYFSRIFKHVTGQTPSEYKRNSRSV